jgi:hypothetical protein
MEIATARPLYRKSFEVARLVQTHPVKLRDPNKKVLFDIASPPNCKHAGQIEMSRWPQIAIPDEIAMTGETILEPRADVFGYETPAPNATEWYLNFANGDLFCAYGAAAFAQDEIQVAEHPALGSLREALIAEKCSVFTVDGNHPTPILIHGVERRCSISTAEIYGRSFARAKRETIQNATKRIEPPTRTNIIAMEAPAGGIGKYSARDLKFILGTAFTGFAAAKIESASMQVTVHTGFWGCGAYGGNRVLMTLLQILAAKLAGIDRLVFHTVTANGIAAVKDASEKLDNFLGNRAGIWTRFLGKSVKDESVSLNEVLCRIENAGFTWGESDGN